MSSVLEKVKEFASRAHGDQTRKFEPGPYIIHPVRVMETVRTYSNDLSVLSAALLHDVLEDTDTTEEEIRNFLDTIMSPTVAVSTVRMVHELTDIFTKMNYPTWNRRKRKTKEAFRLSQVSPEAQTIKYADIMDNSVSMLEAEPQFRKKFLSECKNLLETMKNGDPALRQKALETVSQTIQSISTE